MKLKILDQEKTEIGNTELPNQFYEPIRPDLIQRAFLSIKSNQRQPYGSDPEAGKKTAAKLSRRRRDYRGSYGFGISRVPRKILSRRGTRMFWVGAFAPGTVGGRRAHPPKVIKEWSEKINKKERRKAICSAMAATLNVESVKKRGHIVPNNYPFIIDSDFEKISQTKVLKGILTKLGFEKELQRSKEKESKGLLIVSLNPKKELIKATANIPGFEIISANDLNVDLLAPGGVCGRMTLFTKSAVKYLEESKFFTKNYKPVESKKETTEKKKTRVVITETKETEEKKEEKPKKQKKQTKKKEDKK